MERQHQLLNYVSQTVNRFFACWIIGRKPQGDQVLVITLSLMELLLYTLAEVFLTQELRPLTGQDLRLQGIEAQIL